MSRRFLPAIVVALLLEHSHASGATPGVRQRLPGHVLPALEKATPVDARSARLEGTVEQAPPDEPLTLTIVLRRENEVGFQRFLQAIYNPKSLLYRRYLSPKQLADRFGPSQASYDSVRAYLEQQGFAINEGSENRLTMTVAGTRGLAEKAFGTTIGDYRISERFFRANDSDPELPAEIAPRVQAIIGLTDLARPAAPRASSLTNPFDCFPPGGAKANLACLKKFFWQLAQLTWNNACLIPLARFAFLWLGGVFSIVFFVLTLLVCIFHPPTGIALSPPPLSTAAIAVAAPQKIGLLEFDSFRFSDVNDSLAFNAFPATTINQLSEVKINGGAPIGPNEAEVLLDISVVMTLARDASWVVYDAPFSGGSSFQALFNRMISDGVTVISNSWSYCEDQTSLADVQSIDSILAGAAASGISVFNATGDTGSTCLDGSPNTIGVPADSPNATAVGGATVNLDPNTFVFQGATWWSGAASTPPTGQGGFGTSRFFARPTYQNGFTSSAQRSIPDVVAPADPAANGWGFCQADKGGCPSNLVYGGTSLAAPIWAATAAAFNESHAQVLGFPNPALYSLSGTSSFHSPTSMGSDFAHVGIGFANVSVLNLALQGKSPGPVDGTQSAVAAVPVNPSADGSQAQVVVQLLDAQGSIVSGKTVSLAKSGGSAVITPASGVSTVADGTVTFQVTDTVIEDVTFMAHDDTDNVTISQTAPVKFVAPPATAGNVVAFPTTVAADGVSVSTITVTLNDASNKGAVGKTVTLSQGVGRSQISGPTPTTTDSNGQVVFTATDTFTETVTYTATDVTDGNLVVPVTAQVSFTNGSGSNCNLGQEVPQSGWSITSPETGFALANNCVGVSGTAWDPAGNLWAMNYPNGKLYKFPPTGGTAGAGTLIGTLPNVTPPVGLPSCPHGLTFSKDGLHLYLARQFCGSGGDVVEVSMTNASILRTVATGIPCATGISTDPLSGDLFVSTPCPPGGGTENIYRIANPQSTTPVVSIYSSPGHALGMNFTPDGTLWTEAFPFVTPPCSFPGGTPSANIRYIVKIAGTNATSPGACTYLSTALQNVEGILPALNPANPGSPPFLLASGANVNVGIQKLDLTQNPPAASSVATGGAHTLFINAGPDGCAYVSNGDRIDRITASDGSCSFAPSAANAVLSLTPVTASAVQGSQQSLTAVFVNASVPANTLVYFQTVGANAQTKAGKTDASGRASFAYTGVFSGTDTVTATATVNGTSYTSNAATVTWTAGKHVTFLSLGSSPTSGTAGTAVTLQASLTDMSVNPPVPISGVSILFSLGSQTCTGVTDGNGLASCSITPVSGGTFNLTASFAGSSQAVAASSSSAFFVLGPGVTATATPTSTPTATPTGTPPGTPTPTPTRTATPISVSAAVPMLGGWALGLLGALLAGLGILVSRRAL